MEGEPLLSEVERIIDRLFQKLQQYCALKSRAQELGKGNEDEQFSVH
jgi:hypothetical protein